VAASDLERNLGKYLRFETQGTAIIVNGKNVALYATAKPPNKS
jgi:hypothetical protein